MSAPFLSIITPVFNGVKFIGECLENVAVQKCPSIEHIVIDGGSQDGTIEIVKQFANKHSYVRLYTGNDSGQSEAMNKGLSQAKGTVVGFLNVDDYYEPDTLEKLQSIFQQLPVPSIAVANCNIVDSSGRKIGFNRPSKLSILDLVKGKEYPYNSSSYFYHKNIHSIIGNYDENEHYVMDLDFLLRALSIANVYYYDETWGNFRWMEGTKTYKDYSAGLMLKRSDALRAKYYQKFSLFSKTLLQMYKALTRITNTLKRRLTFSGNSDQ